MVRKLGFGGIFLVMLVASLLIMPSFVDAERSDLEQEYWELKSKKADAEGHVRDAETALRILADKIADKEREYLAAMRDNHERAAGHLREEQEALVDGVGDKGTGGLAELKGAVASAKARLEIQCEREPVKERPPVEERTKESPPVEERTK